MFIYKSTGEVISSATRDFSLGNVSNFSINMDQIVNDWVELEILLQVCSWRTRQYHRVYFSSSFLAIILKDLLNCLGC